MLRAVQRVTDEVRLTVIAFGADGRRARPGERWHWPAGAALGTASPGEVELICAVRAGAAQA